jgi:ribosomal protein S6--L-glutamate ligase
MRCSILSRRKTLYATKRLAEEGRKLGMKVSIYDTLRLSALLTESGLQLFYRDKVLHKQDIIIPRIGASITAFGGCIMFQMEQMGIPLLNSSSGMFNSRDKFRCSQILAANNLPVPRTLMLRRPSNKDLNSNVALERKLLFKSKIQGSVEILNGPPVIIKLNKGTQGVGVILANTLNDVYAQVDMFWKRKEEFIIQEFVKESKGIDVRALVVGDKVIASMKRESRSGDFRSNTHQGGEVSAYILPEDVKEIAVRGTKKVGLNVAGVDMLISNNGYKIIEINSSPGFEGLEKATKKNVAKEIMSFAKQLVVNKSKKDIAA